MEHQKTASTNQKAVANPGSNGRGMIPPLCPPCHLPDLPFLPAMGLVSAVSSPSPAGSGEACWPNAFYAFWGKKSLPVGTTCQTFISPVFFTGKNCRMPVGMHPSHSLPLWIRQWPKLTDLNGPLNGLVKMQKITISMFTKYIHAWNIGLLQNSVGLRSKIYLQITTNLRHQNITINAITGILPHAINNNDVIKHGMLNWRRTVRETNLATKW